MRKILIVVCNNHVADPILNSQLLDIYRESDFFAKRILLADGDRCDHFELYTNFKDQSYLQRLIKLNRLLTKLLKAYKNDEVFLHVRGFVSAFLVSPIIFLHRNINLIYDPRGLFIQELIEIKPTVKFILKWLHVLEKFLIKKSFLTIVTTLRFKDVFDELYHYGDKTVVLYNASSFKNATEIKAFPDENTLNICYCGSFNYWHDIDEIMRLVTYLYQLFLDTHKPIIHIYTSKSVHSKVQEKLVANKVENFVVKFVPYGDLEAELTKMDICLSVVMPTFTGKVASPIKVADYILLNKRMILSSDIGDFDDFYRSSNSAVVYNFGERIDFAAEDIKNLQLEKNFQLKKYFECATNRKIIFDRINELKRIK